MATESVEQKPVKMTAWNGGNGYGPSLAWFQVNGFYFVLAWLMYSCSLVPLDTAVQAYQSEAGFGEHLKWITMVVLRNVVFCVLWYGAMHYALYVKKIASHEDKFNPEWEKGYNVARDQCLTTTGAMIAAGFEIWAIHLWATRAVVPDTAWLLEKPFWNFFWFTFASYWSDVHFWFAHRVMHPWGFKCGGHDIGAVLYRKVHSVHHKSHNPGPWSGLAMHPVEHIIYFSRGACFFLLPAVIHPVHFLFMNFRATVGPAGGHHGFSSHFGSGFHYLHHAKFEVNFGTSRVVPIDNFLGTFSLGGVNEIQTADRSWRTVMWILGLPYLVPIAALTCILP